MEHGVWKSQKKSHVHNICGRKRSLLEILNLYWISEACGQTVLPDWSISIRQKMVENAKIKNWNATFCVIFNRSVEALTSFSFAPLEYTPIQFLALFRLSVSIKKCSNFCGKIAILLFKTLVLQSVLDVVVQFHHVLISRIFCDAVLFQNIWSQMGAQLLFSIFCYWWYR